MELNISLEEKQVERKWCSFRDLNWACFSYSRFELGAGRDRFACVQHCPTLRSIVQLGGWICVHGYPHSAAGYHMQVVAHVVLSLPQNRDSRVCNSDYLLHRRNGRYLQNLLVLLVRSFRARPLHRIADRNREYWRSGPEPEESQREMEKTKAKWIQRSRDREKTKRNLCRRDLRISIFLHHFFRSHNLFFSCLLLPPLRGLIDLCYFGYAHICVWHHLQIPFGWWIRKHIECLKLPRIDSNVRENEERGLRCGISFLWASFLWPKFA